MQKRVHHKPPDIRATFATNLRAARVKAGFTTATSFADELGVDLTRYLRWERGEAEPDLWMLARICEVLDITPTQLMGYSGRSDDQDTG